ncbi:RagB/SusD family nutrient uptake outer membrane protein [Aliifodinibius sp. S!AR15-10]|uniref:RagB/SusD family nutrient uptake outer membrane protein n=1 Tax=Aliifodinibius sp. S!AR15-10 TaxID=2950437 RepID=UPI00285554D4|nr:RagB/SusD family nutrient uptake outer membrane protein [Aliifodinibius sp. S!AR15-10]MDR8393412.1 RagB/SusD family nutrient uptake outer membrane protein [Aliifodinibius sp. S!AR15-10]
MLPIKFRSFVKVIVVAVCIVMLSGCEGFLDYKPKGVVNEENISGADGIERLTTAAYASLGNSDWLYSYESNWLYGSVRSDDAYKGGGALSDQAEMDWYERFVFIREDQGYQHRAWQSLFAGIERANLALRKINELEVQDQSYPLQERIAEMRFLRAHFYFRLVILFKQVPWIDETVSTEAVQEISNVEFTRDQLLDKIAAEFQFAKDNLPDEQEDVGRASAVAAAAYLARTRLYQAYEQDENHNVVNINTERLNQVIAEADYVIDSGKHQLFDDFGKNFITEYDNGPESVFAVQHSFDDGAAQGGRMNYEHGLNYNMASEYGCCWFHIPSHNLVNAFKTDENTGLPLFDTFNDEMVSDTDPDAYLQQTFDPRLSHTVAIPGHPFKYDSDWLYQEGWARQPELYGHHSTMKEVQHPDQQGTQSWGPFWGSAKNVDVIRYDDVLLMKAEALIELGREDEALPLINMIRNRAANSTDMVRYSDGSAPADYNIEPYQDGDNINWTQENAREALRWERRLEFAMESWRFFDLVRWGIAEEVLNDYFAVEQQRKTYLREAQFVANKNEYLPIPQQEIVLSEGLYEQNPGY